MELFFELFAKVLPLYILIGLGFVGGRYLGLGKEPVAKLLIYLIEPAVVLLSLASSNFDISYAGLPLVMFLTCLPIAFATLYLGKLIWKDDTPNLLFFATSTPNTMFYGVPIVNACFGAKLVPVYILTQMGLYLFTFTIGYFQLAKGQYSAQEALKKLSSLPVLWALLIGFPLAFIPFEVPQTVTVFTQHFTGAVIVLGMMLVGIALAEFSSFKLEVKIFTAIFALRYLLWPLALYAIILLDQNFFNLYPPEIHKMFLVFGVLPMAISFVTYAVQTGVQPAIAATAVLITSLFSLLYIPLIFSFFNLSK